VGSEPTLAAGLAEAELTAALEEGVAIARSLMWERKP